MISRGTRRRVRLLGLALIIYGLLGIGLFAVLAIGVTRPLDRAQRLSSSVEEQRAALVVSLAEAEQTIRAMSAGVERMDQSLGEAKTATDRASNISRGVAQSMYQLRDTVSTEIPFLGQPLIGLAPSFDESGRNLDLLGEDVAAIGSALDSNRADVTLTARNMSELADSVEDLADAARESPSVEVSQTTIEAARLAVWAVAAWMALFAIGCVALGAYLMVRRPVVVAPAP